MLLNDVSFGFYRVVESKTFNVVNMLLIFQIDLPLSSFSSHVFVYFSFWLAGRGID